MKVFITGGTGFIGSEIVRQANARGDDVVVLTRSPERAVDAVPDGVELVGGDPQYEGDWQDRLAGCDAVVHLAGSPIAGQRWDSRYKQVVRDSRVDSTMRLVEGMARLPEGQRPQVFACASGIDFYPSAQDLDAHTGAFEDDPVDESTPPGDSFLARVCRAWEKEAAAAELHGARVTRMRTGLVLGDGGALDKLVAPFKLFVGGKIGSGKQWTSWIHLRDAARAYLFALDHSELSGPINLVAPGNVRNAELSKALGRAMSRPSWMPVPGFALKAAVGEFAEYILHGRRAVPKALTDAGFEFDYSELESALADLF